MRLKTSLTTALCVAASVLLLAATDADAKRFKIAFGDADIARRTLCNVFG